MLILPTVKLNIFKTSFIQKSNHIYHNLGYWFMLLMVLAFIEFYTSYLSVIFQPAIPIIHLHFILMTLWMLMLIAQPFLIKYKKLSTHMIIGKISYGLVFLIMLSGFLMIRFSYYRDINQLRQDAAQGLNHFSNYQILQRVAGYMGLPFIWLFWFILFYSLAVINRRKPAIHARFMLATALSLLGPIVDRIVFKLADLAENIRFESVAFLIADFVLSILLWNDYKIKRSTKTLRTTLLIYIIGQALYFTVPGTSAWQYFVTLIMKPNP